MNGIWRFAWRWFASVCLCGTATADDAWPSLEFVPEIEPAPRLADPFGLRSRPDASDMTAGAIWGEAEPLALDWADPADDRHWLDDVRADGTALPPSQDAMAATGRRAVPKSLLRESILTVAHWPNAATYWPDFEEIGLSAPAFANGSLIQLKDVFAERAKPFIELTAGTATASPLLSRRREVLAWSAEQKIFHAFDSADLSIDRTKARSVLSRQHAHDETLLMMPNWRVFSAVDHGGDVNQSTALPGLHPSELPYDANLLTPRIGMSINMLPNQVRGYYSFGQTYNIWGTLDPALTGQLLDPFASELHEAGLATTLFGGSVAVTASGFWMEGDQLGQIFDPGFDDWGETVSSRGAVLSLSGNITRRWSTKVKITRLESTVEKNIDDPEWEPPKKVSGSTASMWNRYDIISNDQHVLGVGLGIRVVDRRKSSYSESLIFPGYSRWDLGIFYEREKLDLQVYLKHILDTRYYTETSELLSDPDSPFELTATLRLRY